MPEFTNPQAVPKSAAAWRMRLQSGLTAHFKQPDGSSRPGVEWLVALERDGERGIESTFARVRGLLADDATKATRGDEHYQAGTSMQYLAAEIAAGWDPHEQREHVIRIGNPLAGAAVAHRRPWWRLW